MGRTDKHKKYASDQSGLAEAKKWSPMISQYTYNATDSRQCTPRLRARQRNRQS